MAEREVGGPGYAGSYWRGVSSSYIGGRGDVPRAAKSVVKRRVRVERASIVLCVKQMRDEEWGARVIF